MGKNVQCFLCGKVRNSQVALHKFPKDPAIRSAWVAFCNLNEDTDNVSTLEICCNHFTWDDYPEPRARLFGNVLRLRRGSVPSIFKPGPSTPSFIMPEPQYKNDPAYQGTSPGTPQKIPGGKFCSVAGCKSNSEKTKENGEKVRYFSFPKNPHIFKEWVMRCDNDEDFLVKHKHVCSKHFRDDDYEDQINGDAMSTHLRKLKKTAIPSLLLLRLPLNVPQEATLLSVKAELDMSTNTPIDCNNAINDYQDSKILVDLLPVVKEEPVDDEYGFKEDLKRKICNLQEENEDLKRKNRKLEENCVLLQNKVAELEERLKV